MKMSKSEIAESLEEINKKLNVLVKKQCGGAMSKHEEEGESKWSDGEGLASGKEKPNAYSLSLSIFLYGKQ
jgi:hypothetical protein